MAKVLTIFPIARTMGNLTFYRMDGQNYVRKKSSLSSKRVKASPQFERTRYHAGLLAQASRIGSALYKALPEHWRQSWMYRSFTGEAMQLLKQGKTAAAAQAILYGIYVKPVAVQCEYTKPVTLRRSYTKRAADYWLRKTAKAAQNKKHRKRLLQHASCMARASVIASGIYRSLRPAQRQYALYKAITGLAMRMLVLGYNETQTQRECLTAVTQPRSTLVLPLRFAPPVFQQAC